MKVKTKFIPFVGTTVVLATSIPLSLTSCGISYVNVTAPYYPSFGRFYNDSSLKCDEPNATNIWTEWLKQNPNNFIEEYYWGWSHYIGLVNSQTWTDTDDLIIEYAYSGQKISNVSMKTTEINLYSKNDQHLNTYTIPLFSFDLDYDSTIMANSSSSVIAFEGLSSRYIGHEEFRNVPLILNANQPDYVDDAQLLWIVVPFISWMSGGLKKNSTDPKQLYYINESAPEWSLNQKYTQKVSGHVRDWSGDHFVDRINSRERFVNNSSEKIDIETLIDEYRYIGITLTWFMSSVQYEKGDYDIWDQHA